MVVHVAMEDGTGVHLWLGRGNYDLRSVFYCSVERNTLVAQDFASRVLHSQSLGQLLSGGPSTPSQGCQVDASRALGWNTSS